MSDLLTTTQAAEVLGVSGRTLARYVERGWLQPTVVLPSGHFRWDVQEIRRQLEEHRGRDPR
ncbi:MAG: helix-turn-helix domain-containing protein [Pseudonocardiaceae bacterium]